MLKKVLLSIICAFLFSKTDVEAQQYDHIIKVTLTITDKTIYNGSRPTGITQNYKLSFGKIDKHQYHGSDKVGFEFNIENYSSSSRKHRYGLTYSPKPTIDIDGAPVPIVLPPEDEEDRNKNFPYIPEKIDLALDDPPNSENVIKLKLYFIHEDGIPRSDYIDIIEVPYFLFLSNTTPAGKKKNKITFNQNYSNTKINYNSSTSNTANIRIYDFNGRLIQTIKAVPVANKSFTSYNFPTPFLRKGLYFYKIDIDGFTETRKVYRK